MSMTDPQTDQIVANGLAEMTLLIEQGHFHAAQERAQELLLRQPNSAAIHAALGDIAAARHQHREAIEWYELALRLQHSHAISEKLAQQRELLDHERLYAGDPNETARAPRPLLIVALAGGAVLLVLVLMVIVGLTRHRKVEKTRVPVPVGRPVARTGQGTEPFSGANPMTRPAARADTPGSYGVGAGSSAVSPSPSAPAGGLKITQSVDAPMADRDVLLTRALAGLSWPNGETLGWRVLALMDPFTGYAMITVEVPPGMRNGALYRPAVDMAWTLAVATIRADQGVESLTVRILTQVENDKGRKVELVAFRGNTTRESLDYYLKRGQQPDTDTIWKHVFATTWWNPSVPSGSAETQSPSPPASLPGEAGH